MTTMTTDPTVHLDVRPMIAAGEAPFDSIMAAAETIPVGGVLELLAPFRPLPLYAEMQQRGFTATTTHENLEAWTVRFTQTGITAQTILSEVAERHPAAVPILAKHGFDLCCGGAKPVEVAARAHGVPLDVLLTELQGVVGGSSKQ